MRSLDAADLSGPELAALRAAMAADPALAAELEAIAEALGPETRRRFWRALARECPRHRRPAAAVLEALVCAARD